MKKKLFIAVAVLIASLLIAGVVIIQLENKHMREVVERNIIYEGIYVGDIHIGGLTETEAIELLKTTIDRRFKDKELKILYEGVVAYQLPFEYFEFETDYEELIHEAKGLAKTGSIKERYDQIQKLKTENIIFSTKEWYNDDKVVQFVDSIKVHYYIEAEDASLEKKGESFIIHEEINGKSIDVKKSVDAINVALVSGDGQVSLEVITTVPEVTKVFYEDIKEVIGTYSTSFSANQEARNENLRIASSFINGTLLKPSETFSTNATIGPTDSEHGYKEAPVIVSGIVQKGYGGGVCQISTTLYNAALNAELEIDERKNHSLAVGYVEKGRDATLAEDYIDFKFTNNTGYPIYIESYIQDYKIVMKIYGKETRPTNRTIAFETELVGTTLPPPEKVTIDKALMPGEEVVDKKAIVGYTVKLYKLIYVDNALQDKVEMNTSYYAAYAAQIRKGPDPVTETSEPVEQSTEGPQ